MSPDENAPQNSASAPITGQWWPCLCGKDAHAQFLPAGTEPEGLHGSFFHVIGGKHTVTTYFRIHTPRCAKALGDAPVAPVQRAARAKVERPVEAVREAGAA
jgi:hypothetical protein